LEPLYKLFSQVVGENEAELKETLNGLGIYLKASDYGMDVKPLLKIVLARFFGDIHGFVDMLVKHVPSPNNAAKTKVGFLFSIFLSWSSNNYLSFFTRFQISTQAH